MQKASKAWTPAATGSANTKDPSNSMNSWKTATEGTTTIGETLAAAWMPATVWTQATAATPTTLDSNKTGDHRNIMNASKSRDASNSEDANNSRMTQMGRSSSNHRDARNSWMTAMAETTPMVGTPATAGRQQQQVVSNRKEDSNSRVYLTPKSPSGRDFIL